MSAAREAAEKVLRDVGVSPVGAALDVTIVIIEESVRAGIVKAMREYVSDLGHHHARCNLRLPNELRFGETCDCDLAELLP